MDVKGAKALSERLAEPYATLIHPPRKVADTAAKG